VQAIASAINSTTSPVSICTAAASGAIESPAVARAKQAMPNLTARPDTATVASAPS
jgi:hypothetical protein